jgi:hypothetical protein
MTRASESIPATLAESNSAQGLLDDGEVVLLAIRPSPWWVILTSLPVLLPAAAVAAGAWVFADRLAEELPLERLLGLCAAAATLRLLWAGVQGLSRLYLLTNRRLLQVSGLRRTEVRQCLLVRVKSTEVSASPPERMVGIGTVLIRAAGESTDGADDVRCRVEPWVGVARPQQVREQIDRAAGRAR